MVAHRQFVRARQSHFLTGVRGFCSVRPIKQTKNKFYRAHGASLRSVAEGTKSPQRNVVKGEYDRRKAKPSDHLKWAGVI
jgi:hypothetical protein